MLNPFLVTAMDISERENTPQCGAVLSSIYLMQQPIRRDSYIISVLEAMNVCNSKDCLRVLAVVLGLLVQSSTIPPRARDLANCIAQRLQNEREGIVPTLH